MQNNRNCKIIPFCPNVKNRRYYIDKLTDWALAAVTTLGAVTAMLFLIML